MDSKVLDVRVEALRSRQFIVNHLRVMASLSGWDVKRVFINQSLMEPFLAVFVTRWKSFKILTFQRRKSECPLTLSVL